MSALHPVRTGARFVTSFALLLLLPACGGGGGGGAVPESLLYEPAARFDAGPQEKHTVGYTDLAGLPRDLQIELRWPDGAPDPLPVVIWSHGGAGGQFNPDSVGRAWGRAFIEAGYLVVAVAHRARIDDGTTDERAELCTARGRALRA